MITFILIIHLVLAIILVGIILLQRSEGGGLGIGNSSSGGMSGFLSGREKASFLTRTTTILAICFMGTSLLLAILETNREQPASLIERIQAPLEQETQDNPADPPSEEQRDHAPDVPLVN